MSLESEVSELKTSTNNLLGAVNIQKSYLDAAAASAIAGVTAQGATVPTPAKSPLGNAQGVFDAAWIDPNSPTLGSKTITTTGYDSLYGLSTYSGLTGAKPDSELSIILSMGVAGRDARAYPGSFAFCTLSGDSSLYSKGYTLRLLAYDTGTSGYTPPLLDVKGSGDILVPGRLDIGVENVSSQGVLKFGIPNSAYFYITAGNYGNSLGAAMRIATHSITGRSIEAGGTLNANGNDYAEYISKGQGCGEIAKGDIIGLTSSDNITDKWEEALLFAVKSTNPSFVGGDDWAFHLGKRPVSQGKVKPTALIRSDKDTEGEWEEKQALYTLALKDYETLAEQEAEELAAFETALETERAKVDRIAIAGRVPVNVYNAAPGDYIVPEQDGEGIKGVAIPEADITFAQYRKAVGQVIKILEDGRAYVMVKVV